MPTSSKNQPLCRPYIRQFYRKNKLPFLGALFAAVMMGAVELGISALIKELMVTMSGTESAFSLSSLLWATLGLMILVVAVQAVDYHAKPRFMKRAMAQYKNYVFEKLSRKSISSFQEESTAAYISALSNDANSIETNYLASRFTLISQCISFFGAFLLMLLYSPILTLVAVGSSLLPIMASLLAGNRLKEAETRVSDRNAHFVATLTDSLRGFSVIKSFKAEKEILALFRECTQSAENAKCRKRKISCIITTIGMVSGAAAQFGVFIAGAWLAVTGRGITAGVVIAFVQLMNYVIAPISQVPEILANQKAARALIEKLASALEINAQSGGTAAPGRLVRGIEIKDLSFAYGEEPVLKDVNIRFEAGRSYAIVGASGSGKSTLLHLMMAAHTTYRGSVCLDDTELRETDSESLYDLISMIQQNVFVFNASIRDNITMFRDFPKEEVDRAAALSGLSGLIEEKGGEYLCGENGANLSGGEKQRISIARSLLRKNQVLLVDEATAALDAKTAWQVFDAILNLEELTRIVVTHSLEEALMRRYDRIVALKDGRIAECGSFDELMEKKGYFYSLFTVSQ